MPYTLLLILRALSFTVFIFGLFLTMAVWLSRDPALVGMGVMMAVAGFSLYGFLNKNNKSLLDSKQKPSVITKIVGYLMIVVASLLILAAILPFLMMALKTGFNPKAMSLLMHPRLFEGIFIQNFVPASLLIYGGQRLIKDAPRFVLNPRSAVIMATVALAVIAIPVFQLTQHIAQPDTARLKQSELIEPVVDDETLNDDNSNEKERPPTTKVESSPDNVIETNSYTQDTLELIMADANRGDAQAQFELGKAYLEGNGVEQSYSQCYIWATMGAQTLKESYAVREDCRKAMSSDEVFDAHNEYSKLSLRIKSELRENGE